MLNWFRRMMPTEDSFFPMFDAHAELLVWFITLPAAGIIGALAYLASNWMW